MNPRSVKNKKFLPQVSTGVTGVSEYYNQSTDAYSDRFVLQTENELLFRKNWNNKHNIIATALFRTSQAQSSSYTSVISGTASAGLADPITGGHICGIGSGSAETRDMSAIFNLHYTLLNKYMLSTTINSEGNSSLGKSERWGIFPALGFAWQLQEEKFLKNITWINQAKVRFSLGYSGNSPSGTAPYMGTFKALDENYIDMPAIAPVKIQLNNLKWESSREYDAGADVILFDNKLNFTFDWYNKRTSDLLQKNIDIPTSTGFSTIAYYNSGAMVNNGMEFRIEYEIFKNKNWFFSINANISRNINKIVELPDNLTEETYSFGNGNYAQRLETGVPIGSFFGYKYLGVYQNKEDTYARDAVGNVMVNMNGDPIVMQNGILRVYPGDAKYEDINHDGVINEYDIVYIGNGMPILTGGGGFQLKYKAFTLTTFFHGRFGQKVINKARMNSEAMYGRDNQSTATLKRWRNEGDDTDIPRALYNYGYNYLGSDRFVENASFLRLKTLSLSYNVPSQKCKHLGISNLNLFITGYDLFTWTNYTGQDPEVSLPNSPKGLVMDNSNTPVSIRFAGGININF
jgi:TonB-linked SusC/RagA family outer membrane protein